jgi:uncharacterized protein with ParB-like and HNH nuclease domain
MLKKRKMLKMLKRKGKKKKKKGKKKMMSFNALSHAEINYQNIKRPQIMSITKSHTDNLGSVFNGNRFIIPAYQRKYSWTDTERKDLWQDISESIKDDMNHFIGTLSFKENKKAGLSADTVYEIIDGQQRITTLYILLSVLIDKISGKELQIVQRNKFIGASGSLKLLPLGDDGVFLDKVLFAFEEIEIEKVSKRSQQLMYAAKNEFASLVNPLTDQEVEDRIVFIQDRIEILVFNVESQAQAVKMFSIINDRGLPLRILDKTKSILMLYSTLHLGESLNNMINDGFEKIFDAYDDLLLLKDKLGILKRLEENSIFTQHYYSAKKLFSDIWNNKDGAETIFNNLKNKCEKLKNDPVGLEQFMTSYLRDFENFACSYSKLVGEVETNPVYHKPFRYLEFTATLYPLLVRLYMQGKLESLLGLLEAIEVRIYKLRGTNPIADIYWLSSYVTEREPDVDEIRSHLINFSEKFVNDHVLSTYLDGALASNGAVRYILLEYFSGVFDYKTYKEFQIEHIFSKNPNFDPADYGFAEDYSYERDRIGNLALLEEGINKGLGNMPPINKVSGYLTSKCTEIRNVAGEIQNGNFSKTSVDSRRKKIIDFCIERFKIRTVGDSVDVFSEVLIDLQE